MRHLKAGLVAFLISAAVSGAALADGIKGAPPPFDKGGVKIALVSYLSQGDYFEAYEAGVARQAKALGVDLHIFQGKQDAALQREQIEQAIALGVQGIIVSHGQPEAVKDVIQKAVDAGIKVVVKDIDIGNPNVPLVSQSDHDIASQVLDEALKRTATNSTPAMSSWPGSAHLNCGEKSGPTSRRGIREFRRKLRGAPSTRTRRQPSRRRQQQRCGPIPTLRSFSRLMMSSLAA
jgi:ABC-type sugar transport system substrate-binding protein